MRFDDQAASGKESNAGGPIVDTLVVVRLACRSLQQPSCIVLHARRQSADQMTAHQARHGLVGPQGRCPQWGEQLNTLHNELAGRRCHRVPAPAEATRTSEHTTGPAEVTHGGL